MFKNIILLTLCILFVPVASICAPQITGISGNVARGEKVIVNGKNFGTKTNPAPIKWDKFESGKDGAPLNSVQPEWNIYASGGAHYSTTDKHSGNLSVRNDFTAKGSPGFATNYFQFTPSNEVYVTYWWKVANIKDGDYSVLKQTRINSSLAAGGGGIYHGTGSTSYGSPAPKSLSLFTSYNNGLTNTAENCCKISFKSYNSWVRIEAYKKLSTPGENNGIIDTSIVGTARYFSDSEMTRASGESFKLDTILLGLMDGHHIGNFQLYLDDIYIDNTRSRIELGDNPDFYSCKYREVQPAIEWSNYSVKFSVNLEQFNEYNTAYIFVVDANGDASSGFKVKIIPAVPHGFRHN